MCSLYQRFIIVSSTFHYSCTVGRVRSKAPIAILKSAPSWIRTSSFSTKRSSNVIRRVSEALWPKFISWWFDSSLHTPVNNKSSLLTKQYQQKKRRVSNLVTISVVRANFWFEHSYTSREHLTMPPILFLKLARQQNKLAQSHPL